MNITSVTLRNTSVSLGSDLANLDFSAIKDNANYLGDREFVITGTLAGETVVVAAKVVFADKVVTTADELKAAVTDDVANNTKLTGYVAVGNDISGTFSASADCAWNDGFAGTLNGCGYTITMVGGAARGLLNCANGCTVLNTRFVATNMQQSWKNHILAQRITNTTVKDCVFEYSLSGLGTWDAQGGVVCAQQGGGPSTVQNCTFTNTGTEAAKLIWGFGPNAYPLTSYVKMSGCSVSGATEHFGCQTTGSNAVSAITAYWDFNASATGQLVKVSE